MVRIYLTIAPLACLGVWACLWLYHAQLLSGITFIADSSDAVLLPILRSALLQLGLVSSVEDLPTTTQMRYAGAAFWSSLVVFFLVWRRDSRLRDTTTLLRRMAETQKEMAQLREELKQREREAMKRKEDERPVRLFMEGAFDIMHYGHMNAFRLATELGDNVELVVGVNSDETIKQCKGPPVMSQFERVTMVQGCRFVDEVIDGTPYVMSEKYLNWVMEEHSIDYVIHGDDPCIVDGKDVYGHVKELGKFRSIPRTEGVSTTDIVGRMLLCTTSHHIPVSKGARRRKSRSGSKTLTSMSEEEVESVASAMSDMESDYADSGHDDSDANAATYRRTSRFLTTGSMLREFARAKRRVKPADARIVYFPGGWDMFHPGHVQALIQAHELGDWVVVGVYNDDIVNANKGKNYPIFNLNERVLSVLGCKHVDDVVVDAPPIIDHEMIASLNIAAVVKGDCPVEGGYAIPEEMGIVHTVKAGSTVSVDDIVGRIHANRERFAAKYKRKQEKEAEYYNERYQKKDTKEKGAPATEPTGLRQRPNAAA